MEKHYNDRIEKEKNKSQEMDEHMDRTLKEVSRVAEGMKDFINDQKRVKDQLNEQRARAKEEAENQKLNEMASMEVMSQKRDEKHRKETVEISNLKFLQKDKHTGELKELESLGIKMKEKQHKENQDIEQYVRKLKEKHLKENIEMKRLVNE